MPETFMLLRKQIILFLFSLLFSGVIFFLSYSTWMNAIEQRDSVRTILQAAKSRYYSALEKKNILDTFENNYIALKQRGIFGSEDRLDWIDAIENTANKFQIPFLKYRIEKQKHLQDIKLTQKYPGIDIFTTIMHLEMQLLHEADLYRTLNHISDISSGLFDIQSCAITRNQSSNESIIQSSTDRNFSSVCTLNWYTMQKKVFRPDQGRHRGGAR